MLRADEVARYLQDNPQFFEDYADTLAQVAIPHPHGGRAISITERQILTLRERAKLLESKLAELIRYGEENDAIGEKVHRLGCALAGASGRDAVFATLDRHLVEDFAVPHVAIRVWDGAGEGREFLPVAESLRADAAAMLHPFCGPAAGQEALAWFGEAGMHVRSLALVPLRDGARCIGLLALASEDVQRFYPEMGTLYLTRIGELASAGLLRVLSGA